MSSGLHGCWFTNFLRGAYAGAQKWQRYCDERKQPVGGGRSEYEYDQILL